MQLLSMAKLIKFEKCVICGSGDLIPNVKPLGYGEGQRQCTMRLARDSNPDALVFKGRKRTEASAVVCGNCGHVYFFANDPDILRLPPDPKS